MKLHVVCVCPSVEVCVRWFEHCVINLTQSYIISLILQNVLVCLIFHTPTNPLLVCEGLQLFFIWFVWA